MAKTYGNTPGLLMFFVQNENNYGLFWAGAETEFSFQMTREREKRWVDTWAAYV
jgi:hypothetical protein